VASQKATDGLIERPKRSIVGPSSTSPPTEASPTGDRARFERCRRAFSGNRYAALYRRWRQDGERVLVTGSSPVVGKAMESGAEKIEPLVPHAYSHLAPMAGVA